MAFLFEIKNNAVIPKAEALMLPEIKKIWDKDASASKKKALDTFAYIEFISSSLKSNPYSGYPLKKRKEILGKLYFNDPDYTPNEDIREALALIEEFQTNGSLTYSYYSAAKAAAEKMKDFFNTVDLTEKNKMGLPIYKPKELTSALLDSDKVLENLRNLEEKVQKEMFGKEIERIRADKTISIFAKVESFND